MPTIRGSVFLLLALLACGDTPSPDAGAAGPADRAVPPAGDPEGDQRPAERVDTVVIEGMPEPIRVTLFRAPDDFPLRFSAYVPEDMAVEADASEDGASVHFIAELGGQRDPEAFLHLYVFPEGTPESEALGVVRAYESSRGIPVSAGLELLPPPEAALEMPWADRGYTFRYQATDGSWLSGTIGLGSHRDRLFHIVTHYPAEYGDGFVPRAGLVLESWRWEDGEPLVPAGAGGGEARGGGS